MITNIRLQHFRSYKDTSFEFEPGVNVIVGPNASGKTNLLESILLITRGKSYRGSDGELVRHGQDWARIDADFAAVHRVVKLEHANTGTIKQFEIDQKPFKRLTLPKTIPSVLFEPNHLLMLTGSPERRREFLDGLIEQTTPGYGTVLRQYKRTLAQRNRLLKAGAGVAGGQLFAWDLRLSDLGAQIAAARQAMAAAINKDLATIYSELARRKTTLTLIYDSPAAADNYASLMLKKLEKDRSLDLLRGFTGAGPHREDILCELDGQPLGQVASRGEARTTLLALKIIELKLIEALRDQKPLLLLDDVFSELDGARRKSLTEFMKDYQTFITTTDADMIVEHLPTSTSAIAL